MVSILKLIFERFNMEVSVHIPVLLVLLFFLVALVYSSIGLGGGSSYTSLMALFGFNILAIPIISLTLNIMVTSVGSYNYIRNKQAKLNLILPFLISSIPAAYLGGSFQLSKQIFYWVLLITLSFVAWKIYFWQNNSQSIEIESKYKVIISLAAGSLLGLIAGIVGIGGGIYLVPLIIALNLGSQKQAAACGVIFVWFNSCSGLLSRMQNNPVELTSYLPVVIAVLIGGYLGSYLGAYKFSARFMEKILGLVIIVALVFLLKKVNLAFDLVLI